MNVNKILKFPASYKKIFRMKWNACDEWVQNILSMSTKWKRSWYYMNVKRIPSYKMTFKMKSNEPVKSVHATNTAWLQIPSCMRIIVMIWQPKFLHSSSKWHIILNCQTENCYLDSCSMNKILSWIVQSKSKYSLVNNGEVENRNDPTWFLFYNLNNLWNLFFPCWQEPFEAILFCKKIKNKPSEFLVLKQFIVSQKSQTITYFHL